MKLPKLLGKHTNKIVTIVIILGVVALVGALLKYNNDKSVLSDGMMNIDNAPAANGEAANGDAPADAPVVVGASESDADDFLSVSGLETTKPSQKNCNDQPMMDPKELLPSDANNEWSNIAPSKDLANIPLINAGHHIGVNTIGSSLRNANLQVRSEPVIPKTNTGPWNNTTIEPDTSRKAFEIGTQMQ